MANFSQVRVEFPLTPRGSSKRGRKDVTSFGPASHCSPQEQGDLCRKRLEVSEHAQTCASGELVSKEPMHLALQASVACKVHAQSSPKVTSIITSVTVGEADCVSASVISPLIGWLGDCQERMRSCFYLLAFYVHCTFGVNNVPVSIKL